MEREVEYILPWVELRSPLAHYDIAGDDILIWISRGIQYLARYDMQGGRTYQRTS